jgi:menaquinone-dependent protoporphyrinogen IX oxidase
MNIHIIYESKYGNGKEAMIYLESLLTKKGYSVQRNHIHDIKPQQLPNADLYVFSAPNAFGKIVRSMRKFLEKIEGQPTMRYILVNTCLNPSSSQDKGLEQMEEILHEKNLIKLSEGLKLKVMGMKGPLEPGYKQKLEELASTIQAHVSL